MVFDSQQLPIVELTLFMNLPYRVVWPYPTVAGGKNPGAASKGQPNSAGVVAGVVAGMVAGVVAGVVPEVVPAYLSH